MKSRSQNPLVSVLLPVYNGSEFITECIESILAQTYSNFELLVLDDASNDNTVDILKSYRDQRIRLFTEEKNMGIVYQLNKGLSMAQGKYIARMDADDIAYPIRFMKQINFFETNPDVDVVGSQAEKIGDDTGLIKYPTSPRCVDFLLNYYCSVLHPSVMMRSSLFHEKGFKYEQIPYAEDYHLWIKISNGKNIANIDEVLLKYRIHGNQTNKIKFNEQYQGTLKAREQKLVRTFKYCSGSFIKKVNRLSNDYIFWGYSDLNSPKNIRLFERTMYWLHFLKNRKCVKPIVSFVLNNI